MPGQLVELKPTLYRSKGSVSSGAQYVLEHAGYDDVEQFEEEQKYGSDRIILQVVDSGSGTWYVRGFAVFGGPYGHFDGRTPLPFTFGGTVDLPKRDARRLEKCDEKVVKAQIEMYEALQEAGDLS